MFQFYILFSVISIIHDCIWYINLSISVNLLLLM